MISQGQGGYKNLWVNGENPNVKGRTHQNCQLPFLSYSQSFIIAKNWLSWLLHGIGKVWKPKFELEKPSIFGKRILIPSASKNPKTSSHSNMLSLFHVFLTIFLHVGLLEVAGTSCVCIHSCFWLFMSFSLGWEIVF